MTQRRLDTIVVHAGQETPDPTTGSRAVPIYQTASWLESQAARQCGRRLRSPADRKMPAS